MEKIVNIVRTLIYQRYGIDAEFETKWNRNKTILRLTQTNVETTTDMLTCNKLLSDLFKNGQLECKICQQDEEICTVTIHIYYEHPDGGFNGHTLYYGELPNLKLKIEEENGD